MLDFKDPTTVGQYENCTCNVRNQYNHTALILLKPWEKERKVSFSKGELSCAPIDVYI